ncbi:MAG: oligosaccharide flippase family protein, partial [Candidatus Angelobacter sp.]
MRNTDSQTDLISSAVGLPTLTSSSSHATGLSALKQRARHSMAALFIRYGLALIVSFAGTVLLSRLVGPEIWGAFAIAQVVYLSSQEILGRGIATQLIKQQSAPSTVDIGTTFFLQHLAGLLFLLGAGLFANTAARWYSHPELVPLMCASALASYLYAWRSLPVALLERELDYVRVAVVEILDAMSFSVTAIVFAWFGHPIAGLAIALVARSLFSTVAAYLLKPVRPRFVLSRRSISRVMGFGGFIAASSLLNILILAIPALLGGWIVGVSNVGQVQMTISLYSSLLFASAAILRLSFSAYSRILEYPGELQRTVSNNLEMAAAALVPAVVLFAGLSPVWVSLVFGAKWSALPVLLLAHAPAYLLSCVFWGVMSSALVVSGKHQLVFVFLMGFVAVYATLTVIATAKLGPLGVPVAASITHIIMYPLLIGIYGRSLGRIRYRKVIGELFRGALFLPLMWWCAEHWGWIAMAIAS